MEDLRTDLTVILDTIRKFEVQKDGGVVVAKGYNHSNGGALDLISLAEFGSTPEEAVSKFANKCREYVALRGGSFTAKS